MSHMAVEVLPEACILAKGAISAAWHVAADAIELEVLLLRSLFQIGQVACIIVGHV